MRWPCFPTKSLSVNVNDWNGSLDHVQFVRDFNITDFQQVRIQIDTSGVTLPDADDNTYKPVGSALHNAVDTFTAGMRDKLSRPPIIADFDSTSKTLVIHAVVTEMNPGSQSLRFWVGMGSGVAVTTIKGDVKDGSNGDVYLSFDNTVKDYAGLPSYEDLLNGTIRRTGRGVGALLADFTPK